MCYAECGQLASALAIFMLIPSVPVIVLIQKLLSRSILTGSIKMKWDATKQSLDVAKKRENAYHKMCEVRRTLQILQVLARPEPFTAD
jgi:hypothetical protein